MVTRIRKFCTYSLGDSDRLSESSSRLIILSGNANPQLAKDIAAYLSVPLAKALVSRFSDGEIMVELMEHVRGKDVLCSAYLRPY